MVWLTLNFYKLIQLLLPTFLRKEKQTAFLNSLVKPVEKLHKETLYKMQHDGRTIYLEKLLNEYFAITNYTPMNHEATKKVYISDIAQEPRLYLYQDEELEEMFLNDDAVNNAMDVFIDEDNRASYSWIIFIPAAIVFDEIKVRAFVDEFRFIGRKYKIQTY